ncbi:Scr1 family TA system antitoxin-like transcriptional regulator [Streptomyces sp. 8N616]|uniref:Scr1 family TA system antitoxin-like transcriptional regulator n=1 Tax=Streptomyces sp. 8N616 TaxID=3457414 RepID=UPI003FD62E3C
MLAFPDPTPDLVWLENPKNSVYLEAPDDAENYREVFDHLRACALSPAETRPRIAQIIKELHR